MTGFSPDVDASTGLVRRPPPAAYPFGPASVARALGDTVTVDPGRIALIDGDRSWSYASLEAAVDRCARQLLAAGVEPGDRVIWSLPNCAELVIGFMATFRTGGVWVGLHPRLAESERAELVAQADPSLTVDSVEWLDSIDPGTSRFPTVDPLLPGAIAFTSGTTGTPKGVVHSQHNLLWPGLVSRETEPPEQPDVTGTPLPLTTLNMMVLGPLTAFLRQGTAVVIDRIDPAGFVAAVRATGLTRALVVPTLLHDLLTAEVEPSQLGSLRTVLVGGAGSPPALIDAFRERFGLTPTLSYGLSEAPSGVARTGARPGAGARALAPLEVTIRDEDGNLLPSGEEGEICLTPTESGPWARCWTGTLGYWRDPAATRTLYEGDVLHTADIGVLDPSGRLRVLGRSGDVIIRGGSNVHPVEVERVLVAHPAVDTAAVVGLPDDRLGERVAAIVTGADIDIDTVVAHCRTQLAPYKIPSSVLVVDEVPVNAGGKVVRSEVRAFFDDP